MVCEVMIRLGYEVCPKQNNPSAFVLAASMEGQHKLLKLCEAVQRNGPVRKGVTECYQDELVFVQCSFIDGATSELAADGHAIRPYAPFVQGDTHWTYWATGRNYIVKRVGRCERSVSIDAKEESITSRALFCAMK